jgi:hypothetical protein
MPMNLPTTLDSICPELLSHIISKLDAASICALICTAKAFKQHCDTQDIRTRLAIGGIVHTMNRWVDERLLHSRGTPTRCRCS